MVSKKLYGMTDSIPFRKMIIERRFGLLGHRFDNDTSNAKNFKEFWSNTNYLQGRPLKNLLVTFKESIEKAILTTNLESLKAIAHERNVTLYDTLILVVIIFLFLKQNIT